MTSHIESVLVSIATFRRPEGLTKLLESVHRIQSSAAIRVVVVDNDPDRSAHPLVATKFETVEYLHEPRPGIAAARNRGLQALEPRDDAIVFVDDDESVPEDWLDLLIRGAHEYGADIVCGPVVPEFLPDAPKWLRDASVFRRAVHPTGSSIGLPASNNTLVRRDVLERLDYPTFSEEFSLSGGSDSEFFSRLVGLHGARFVWVAEAAVVEDVPAERTTFRWAWRRSARLGNVLGRLHLRDRSRLRVMCGGFARIAHGLLLVLAAPITGGSVRAALVGAPAKGWGMMTVVLGSVSREYAR